jgi:hypothetical protein
MARVAFEDFGEDSEAAEPRRDVGWSSLHNRTMRRDQRGDPQPDPRLMVIDRRSFLLNALAAAGTACAAVATGCSGRGGNAPLKNADDPRIAKAINWLRNHHQPDRAAGFDEKTGQPWGLGLRFYYAHAISRVLPGLPIELSAQASDGSFRNSVNLVKEDDPLIATTFALYVMAR